MRVIGGVYQIFSFPCVKYTLAPVYSITLHYAVVCTFYVHITYIHEMRWSWLAIEKDQLFQK